MTRPVLAPGDRWLSSASAAKHLDHPNRKAFDMHARRTGLMHLAYRDGRRLLWRLSDLDAHVRVSTHRHEASVR